MKTLLAALLVFAGGVARAGSFGACGPMTPSNVFFVFHGASTSCSPLSSPCNAGEMIEFHVSTNGYNFDCAPHTFQWDFGDGTTATTRETVHAYSFPGVYFVSVTITAPSSQVGLTRELTVASIDPPPPPLTATRISPRGFRFTLSPALPVGEWTWDFGDGTIEHGPEPERTHVYPRGGTFTVRVTSNVHPASYTITVTVPVERLRSVRH